MPTSQRLFPSRLAACVGVVLAVGAALTAWQAAAAPATEDSAPLEVFTGNAGASVFVPITPVRILDSRDPVDLGLDGPFSSRVAQDLQVTGLIETANGVQSVIPGRATAVSLNVTVLNSTADGFVSVRPADAPGLPTTSNLNFAAGDVIPNAVTVRLPPSGPDEGKIELTYDALGATGPTADLLVDMVGFYKDGASLEQGRLEYHGSTYTRVGVGPVTEFRHMPGYTEASGDGFVMIDIDGPTSIGGAPHSAFLVEYCIKSVSGGAFVAEALVVDPVLPGPSSDPIDRDAPGCFVIDMNGRSGPLVLELAGGSGARIQLSEVTSLWSGVPD